MLTIGIILIIVSILLVIWVLYSWKNIHQINQDVDKQNQEINQQNKELKEVNQELYNYYQQIYNTIENNKQQLSDIQSNITKTINKIMEENIIS